MLGWHINVYPKPETFALEARDYGVFHNVDQGECLASWEAGLGGAKWADDLVAQGLGQCLVTNGGYPMTYELHGPSVQAILAAAPYLSSWSKVWVRDDTELPDRVIVDFWDQS